MSSAKKAHVSKPFSRLWFAGYLLRFHLASDWLRNKHAKILPGVYGNWKDCKSTLLIFVGLVNMADWRRYAAAQKAKRKGKKI